MRILKAHQRVDHVEFGPMGTLLAVGTGGLTYWPSPTSDTAPVASQTSQVWDATFVADGRIIAVSTAEGVHLFQPNPPEHRYELLGRHRVRNELVYCPDGVLILHGFSQSLIGFDIPASGDKVTMANMAWAQQWHDHLSPPALLPQSGHVIQFDYRNTRSPSKPYWLVVRLPTTGAIDLQWEVSTFAQGPMVVSPDDRWLAILMAKAVVIFDLSDMRTEAVHRISRTNRLAFTDLAFHPSGRFLAVTSNDATVKLYDTSNWSLATTYTWDIGRMRSVAFSPDGLLAAAGSDTGKVIVWDVDP